MFNFNLIAITILLISCDIKYINSALHPANELTIVENEGFLAYIPNKSDYGSLNKCVAIIQDVTYVIDLVIEPAHVYTINEVGVLERFGKSECGVRIKKIAKMVPLITIVGKYQNAENISEKLKITVLPPYSGPKVHNITIDDSKPLVVLKCPGSDDSTARYCRIHDSMGDVFDGCEKSFTYTPSYNKWTCQVLRWGDMLETETVINFIENEPIKAVMKSIKETDQKIIFTCKMKTTLSLCRAETPKKQQLHIGDGLVTDRYTSYDTKLSDGLCSLEIKKPLLPDEIGVWRFYLSTGTGCIFDMTGIKPKSDTNSTQVRTVEDAEVIDLIAGTNFIFTCEVPYEISYCYLQPPKRIENKFLPLKFEQTKYLGICQFEVLNFTSSHSGNWVCGINSNSGSSDILKYSNIKVHVVPAEVLVQTRNAKKGNSAKFLCKTLHDEPIKYCRFVAPNGDVHSVAEDMLLTTRFKYYGISLLNGDCGIEIDGLIESDFGNWQCVLQTMKSNNEFTLNMNLSKETLSIAWAVGLGIGTAVVVLFGSLLFGYKYRNRNNYGSGNIAFSDTSSRNSIE